jgi:hypothetical protein
MARSIIGVIVGYLVMFVFVFVTFTIVYLAMGADRAFRPGSYETSTLWLAVSFILGTIAAVLGGVFCRLIARNMMAVYVLAGIVLVLGILFAIPSLTSEPAESTRTAEVANLEAMQSARTPLIPAVLNPVIGALGAIIGGLLVERRRSEPRPMQGV